MIATTAAADWAQVGNGGLSLTWEQIHFSLWSILAAPLLISTDLTTLSEESLAVLLNLAVIEVNQVRNRPKINRQNALSYPIDLDDQKEDRPGTAIYKWEDWGGMI